MMVTGVDRKQSTVVRHQVNLWSKLHSGIWSMNSQSMGHSAKALSDHVSMRKTEIRKGADIA